MANGRVGGAGQVWPDHNINFLSKQVAYNAEASQIEPNRIVCLRSTNNGSALSAFLVNPTNAAHWDGIWAVSRGGFGTQNGETSGMVVQWAIVDLATNTSALDAPVYVNAANPGEITLAPSAGAAVVGKVIRVGLSAADTTNTVLLYPEAMRSAGNAAEIQDVGDTGTFADASLVIGSGGTCRLGIAGTRILNAPVIAGQEVTFATTGTNANVITVATTVNQVGNNTLTFGAATDVIVLRSVAVGGTLRWRVLLNDGVGLTTV
jgi:hypothetical protein